VSAAHPGFYITSGTLAGSAPSYVVRAADEALFQALRDSEYCYVLSSRQVGKSSLMIHTLGRLQAVGVAVAVVDLTRLGFNLNAEEWYNSLLEQLGGRLNLRAEARDFAAKHAAHSPLQRWMGMIREVLLARIPGRIVIFIDEIDLVRRLPFSTDEFFAAIRACYNARAEDDAYQRLTFCLLGVATPSDLIEDARLTPFNIGTRIHLEDFTPAEAALLEAGLGRDPETNRRLMARILSWTGGHPCLTQRLCKAVVECTPIGSTMNDVDASCTRLFLTPRGDRTEDNLAFVSQRLLGSTEEEATELLVLYERVLAGKPVQDDETRPLVARLKLSGVVRAERERLIVRNRIYAHVFDRAWVRKHLPGAERQRQRAAFRRGVLRTATVAAVMLTVVASLAITAVREANRANRYAQQARAEAARSQELLYASDMSLMQVAYEQNDFRHLRSLLEETRSNPDHGFEWFYWQGKLHAEALTLNGHTREVTGTAFSPDSRRILTCGEDGFVKVWDVLTGRELLAIRHSSGVVGASFSPDGRMIVSTDADIGSNLWEAATGSCLAKHPSVGILEFCATMPLHGQREDGWLKGWHDAPLVTLHNRLLINRHWRSRPGATTIFTLAPDGRRQVSVTAGRSARLLDGETQRPISILTAHADKICKVLFSPDSRRLVLCNRDGSVDICDAVTGRLLRTLAGHREEVRMAAFSPDGRRIVTVGDDRTGIVWDLATGQQLAALRGHDDGILWVCYSPDGRWIATAGRDGTVKIWSAKIDQELPTLAPKNLDTAVVSHTGNRLITYGDKGGAKVWDTKTRRVLVVLKGYTGHVNIVLYSLDDRKILTAGDDGVVRVWNAADGAPLLRLTGSGAHVRSAAFSPDGRRIVTATDDHNVKVWDAETGQPLFPLIGHTDRIVFSTVFSPDGRLIATSSADKTARIWDAATGKPIYTLAGHTERVYSVAFSSDGGQLVTGSRDRTARVWDVKTGKPLLTLEGQDAPVYAAVFSPDGRRILTGGGRTARLWNASNGRQMLVLQANGNEVSSVAFSPDGGQILTADGDHAAQIWSIPPASLLSHN
jgi:WD40 repeat protein